jgi:type II secretory pathway pseudopilin PulG
MHKRQNFNNNKGISIVELLVAAAIVGAVIASLITFGSFSVRTASLAKQTTQASFLAQDAMEALKNYRDNTGWNTNDPEDQYDGLGVLLTGVPFHPNLSGDVSARWQMLSGQETIGIFQRSVMFEGVFRDGADNIVESGGTLDSQTKKATVMISWMERGNNREFKLVSYLANWK